jgi:dTDP-4-amino-4,6-dideoxy-D-galactose acyltransferase
MSRTAALPKAGPLCEYLEWDSQFFGSRIARLAQNHLTCETAAEVLRWCGANQVDCLYFLTDSNDPRTVALALANGFQLVDIRVTLERRPGYPEPAPSIRPFQPADALELRRIARVSHWDSRFYHDGRFPRRQVDALYETWIDRSYSGWADAVLVAECDGAPVGYISCHLAPPSAGSIGLVAVAPGYQRRGLGRQLVEASLDYFRQHNVERVSVVTQGRNTGSQCLYHRCGFLTESVQLWYHRWFSGSRPLTP